MIIAAVIFCLIHLLICIAVGLLFKSGRIKTRSLIFPAVVFVPVFGLLLLLLEEREERIRQMEQRTIGLEKLKIQDVKYRKIEVSSGENEKITVPLEEAMAVNDADVRRKLMMEILQRDPEQYIDLLQKARMAEDVELTHYATTAMQEIQGNYEKTLHRLSIELVENPKDRKTLLRCRREYSRYIESGLLSGSILTVYRRQLDHILSTLCELEPENKNYKTDWISNRIALEEPEGVEEVLEELLLKWPEDEKVYRICVEFYWTKGQKADIRRILDKIQKQEFYLSGSGKQWFAFWNQKEHTNE